MVYQTAEEICYSQLILLKWPVLSDEDVCTFHSHPHHGGGAPVVFLTYQQLVLAQGYVKNAKDAEATFMAMVGFVTPSQCQRYFMVLLHCKYCYTCNMWKWRKKAKYDARLNSSCRIYYLSSWATTVLKDQIFFSGVWLSDTWHHANWTSTGTN